MDNSVIIAVFETIAIAVEVKGEGVNVNFVHPITFLRKEEENGHLPSVPSGN